MTAATRSLRFIRHWRRSVRSPHRPDRKNFLFLPVGAGVPTARTWACINFPTIRRAGPMCPAARCTTGRAHGPCPTKRPVGRDLCVPPPITAAFPATCHCEPVTDVTGVAIRIPALRLRRLPFFLRRKKGRKERRQNQWFWNPFRGQDTARSGTIQPRELSTAKFAPCLRILSASNAAMRSAPVLAWRDGGNLCVCRGGAMWASPPTAFYR